MGQYEVLDLIERFPRLCAKEIAIMMKENYSKTCLLLSKLIRNKEIIAHPPTDEEVKRILDINPSSRRGLWNLKVYEAIK